MNYILYNPLSSNGKGEESIKTIKKIMKKKDDEFESLNIIEVSKDIESFVSKLNEEDQIIVVGGDGTLHHFANSIRNITKTNRLFLYKGGTGNDFGREFKKKKLIEITEYVRNLPVCKINNKHEFVFLNCSGFGFDGAVCAGVNENNGKKSGFAYIKNVLSLLKNSPRYDLELEVDGVKKKYEKVLFTEICNGKYFGGGMKLSPTSDRKDDVLELYLVYKMKFAKILCVFPFIFIGKHMWFKRWGIERLQGKHFHLKASFEQPFQSDGEVILGVDEIEVTR